MLVRNNNEIEIWTDTIKKGTGKRFIIIALIVMIIFLCLMISMECDFSIIETYYLLAILFFLCILITIRGLIFTNREKSKKLILRVNADFIEIFNKKKNKVIELEQITKVNNVNSIYGSFVVIFYNANGVNKKYTLSISAANRNLVTIALKEYKKDIVINNI